MTTINNNSPHTTARWVGLSLLASIAVGIIAVMTVSKGIDINLNADVLGTAETMLGAETQLRAKAYLTALSFGLSVLISTGLYLILKRHGPLLAAWSLLVGVCAAVLPLLGGVFALNAAHIAGNDAYTTLTDENGRLLLAGLQATSDYTSFHLSLVISSVSMAGFFLLFWRAQSIPKLISGFGVFASLFVATTIVARDFIPALANNTVTMAFMLCNMIAILSLALYLIVKGVRTT